MMDWIYLIYMRYCAEIMAIDQQTLAVAVARQLDGIKGNGEAQDFLQRQQLRERQKATASSLYVEKPQTPSDAPWGKSYTAGTTSETLERDLTKYLIKYGHCNCSALEDNQVVEFNVASYIFQQLDEDNLQFSIDVYRTIMELYRSEWERLGEGVEVPSHIFINHHDPNLSRVSIDLLTADDNYVISKIWEQKDVHIESVEEQLAVAVPKAVSLYKWRYLDNRIAELQARLVVEGEDLESILALLAKYKSARVVISKNLGRLI